MIASMKKARIVILKDDLEAVLKEIQKVSCLMVVKQEESASTFVSVDGLISRADTTLKEMKKYKEKDGLFTTLNSSEDSLINNSQEVLDTINKVEELISLKNNLINEIKTLEDEITTYSVWENLFLKLNELKDTKYSRIHIGFIENKYVNEFSDFCKEENLYFEVLNVCKNLRAVCYIDYYEDESEIGLKIKTFGFNQATLPTYNGFMVDYLKNLNSLISDKNSEIDKIDNELKTLSSKSNEVKVYVDSLLTTKQRGEADYSQTLSVYFIDGWIPENKIDTLKKAIEKVTDTYDCEFLDPTEDDNVPTYTVNNKFVTPFESITNMFSIPSWKELDPNPIMSLWYWVLFGMMMGDFGYGIILFLGAFLFIKLTKPVKGTLNLAKVLMFSSLPTMIWGIIFNSYFGASLYEITKIESLDYHIISPMNDAMPMLILSVVVGCLHIVTGLIVKAIKDIKGKDIFEFLGCDLSWICLLLGIFMFAGTMDMIANMGGFNPLPPLVKTIGIVLILVGVAFILLFGGHAKKGIVGKAVGGLAGLYNITSYLGDLLSYSRIMALVMSSASVALVMNTLAKMVGGSGGIMIIFQVLIYIVGHLFNLVLGLLSAYVHDCRLQYIEFYGKFYDGGGILFKPLSVQTKYVNEITK